jgi:hypothetical protein
MEPWKTRANKPIIPAVIAVVLTEVPSIAVPFSTIWEKRWLMVVAMFGGIGTLEIRKCKCWLKFHDWKSSVAEAALR